MRKLANYKFSKGTILNFTSGCYSDYQLQGMFVALEDVDLPKLCQSWYAEDVKRANKENWYNIGEWEGFISHLIKEEKILPIQTTEVHLGDYNDWDDEWGVEDKCELRKRLGIPSIWTGYQ